MKSLRNRLAVVFGFLKEEDLEEFKHTGDQSLCTRKLAEYQDESHTVGLDFDDCASLFEGHFDEDDEISFACFLVVELDLSRGHKIEYRTVEHGS